MDEAHRLSFLAELFRLPRLAVAAVALLLDEPGGWTADALADRLAVPREILDAELAPDAPLVAWGILRSVYPSVTLNHRIARYLADPPRV